MAHICITKGLDIPIKGKPSGKVHPLVPGGEVSALTAPNQIALDLKPFEDLRLKILVKPGDVVSIGQPLAEDKASPGRMFVSPAGGIVKEVRRGAKRVPLDIIIEVAKEEAYHELTALTSENASREEIIAHLKAGGLFAGIRSRPFDLLANPAKAPRSIFVKAVESAPFAPPAELQVEGRENEFQQGLNALAKLAEGRVHLVYRKESHLKAFKEAKNVEKHTVEGPHPCANASMHIYHIDPISRPEDIVWTLNAHDVVSIGHLLSTGRYFTDRIISIAGPAILPDRIGYFKARQGYPVASLIENRLRKGIVRLISGDPLMGRKVLADDFLGYYDYVFCAIPENVRREFLHFMGLGLNRYTFSKAYITGHLNNENREYDFTTSQHGEHRAFIDGSLYDKVMPLDISTIHLVKAVMAEDYDLAEQYGLLEVAPEDFALPTFVCPSKIEMSEIIRHGLKVYAKETGVSP